MSESYQFRLPKPGQITNLVWSDVSLSRSPVRHWRSSVFELSATMDKNQVLNLAGEHTLKGELLRAEKDSLDDSESIWNFENIKRDGVDSTLAAFFVHHRLLVAVAVSVPTRFEAEALVILNAYSDAVRQKLDRLIHERSMRLARQR